MKSAQPVSKKAMFGHLLEEIKEEIRDTQAYTGIAVLSDPVVTALSKVPRELFVSKDLEYSAYYNLALPIGCGQTISQPFIVALMSELIHAQPDDVVLEIGTGSGYQTAVLSSLVRKVYSIEIIRDLAIEAHHRLDQLAIDNVEIDVGDGNFGWAEHAPYNSIIVTAAAPSIPATLVEQLDFGGRLVIPLGSCFGQQMLSVVTRNKNGMVKTKSLLPVAFVPMTGLLEKVI